MKNLSIVLVLLVFILTNTEAQNSEVTSTVNITVTDMQNVPSEGDKLYFVSQTTNEIFTCVTGEGGKCVIELANGQIFNIKIKTFDQAQNYTSVEIANTDYHMNLELTIKYELPKTYTLNDVKFAMGSSNLVASSFASLNELAELMLLKKELKIELAGHTDNVGNDQSNLQLSQARANSVKNYLVKKGVPSSQLIAKGYGETSPIASNDTPEGKQKNRRTEVHILE